MHKLTNEQRRARHAWGKAQSGVDSFGSKYVNNAKGLPALIMNSGLMQVMAFLEGKKDSHAVLGMHLREWLHEQCETPADFHSFMEHLADMRDAREFQRVTTEALAWLKWLRQLAPAAQAAKEP